MPLWKGRFKNSMLESIHARGKSVFVACNLTEYFKSRIGTRILLLRHSGRHSLAANCNWTKVFQCYIIAFVHKVTTHLYTRSPHICTQGHHTFVHKVTTHLYTRSPHTSATLCRILAYHFNAEAGLLAGESIITKATNLLTHTTTRHRLHSFSFIWYDLVPLASTVLSRCDPLTLTYAVLETCRNS